MTENLENNQNGYNCIKLQKHFKCQRMQQRWRNKFFFSLCLYYNIERYEMNSISFTYCLAVDNSDKIMYLRQTVKIILSLPLVLLLFCNLVNQTYHKRVVNSVLHYHVHDIRGSSLCCLPLNYCLFPYFVPHWQSQHTGFILL